MQSQKRATEPSPSASAPDGTVQARANLDAVISTLTNWNVRWRNGHGSVPNDSTCKYAIRLLKNTIDLLKDAPALPAQGRPGPSEDYRRKPYDALEKELAVAFKAGGPHADLLRRSLDAFVDVRKDLDCLREYVAATPSPVEGRPSELAAHALHLAGRLRAPQVLYDGFLREDTAQTLERLAASAVGGHTEGSGEDCPKCLSEAYAAGREAGREEAAGPTPQGEASKIKLYGALSYIQAFADARCKRDTKELEFWRLVRNKAEEAMQDSDAP